MGVKKLRSLIEEQAPKSIKNTEFKSLEGRIIAVDSSNNLYQFLTAIGTDGGSSLMNSVGETTSHLQGTFYRTIKFVSNGIKPVFVFDGAPPVLKSGELAKRSAKKKEAKENLDEAKETGTTEDVAKFSKRTTSATKKQNEECIKLLTLMGIPIVRAPCEAEAQCAELVKGGKAWAAGSEDMDTLAFGTKILLRNLTASDQKKNPLWEFNHERLLETIGFTQDQFIDLCILLGCDYCESIRGIGPVRAFELMLKHKSIEEVIKHLDQTKYPVPNPFPFDEARELFKNPRVTPASEIELVWGEPDEEGIIAFLVGEMGFAEDRVKNGIEKLKKYKDTGVQTRIDNFFQVVKRPREEEEAANKLKKAKPGASKAKSKPSAKPAAKKAAGARKY